MSDTIEVNLPTYQMEPDPPRFPLRKLIRYMVLLVLIWAGYTYRAEIMGLLKTSFAKFDEVMGAPSDAAPQRDAAPPRDIVPPRAEAASSDLRDVVDPEDDMGIAAVPPRLIGNPETWIKPEDDPRKALSENAEGTVDFSVFVDAKGQPISCHINRQSGHEELGEATCRVMMANARFQPAEDRAGKAVESVWSSRIVWKVAR